MQSGASADSERDAAQGTRGELGVYLSSSRRAASRLRASYRAVIDELFGGFPPALGPPALGPPTLGPPTLSEQMRSLVLSALRQLVLEVESALKPSLAERARAPGELPESLPYLVGAVRGDELFAAIAACGAFDDILMVESVLHRILEHRLSDSLRAESLRGDSLRVGQDASAASSGVRDQGDRLIVDLAQSADAAVRDALGRYLVDKSRRIDRYGNPVILSADLAPAFVARLYWRVAGVLRGQLAIKARIAPWALDDWIEAATLAAIADWNRAIRPNGFDDRLGRVAEIVDRAGAIVPAQYPLLLHAGEVPLVVGLTAHRAGQSLLLVRRLIGEPLGEGFAILFKGLGADQALYDLVRRPIARHLPAPFDRRAIAGDGAATFARIDAAAAGAVLRHWARDAAYLEALYDLDRAAEAK